MASACRGAWPPRRLWAPEIAGSTPAGQTLRRRGGAVLASLMSSRSWVRIPPALLHPGDVAQRQEQSLVRRETAGSSPVVPVRLTWWSWCNGSIRGRDPRGSGSNPAGRPSSPGDEALVVERLACNEEVWVRLPPSPSHASVVSTASTRPLYGRGAGSTPAGGSSRGRSSDGRAPERHSGEARSIRAVRFRRPVV